MKLKFMFTVLDEFLFRFLVGLVSILLPKTARLLRFLGIIFFMANSMVRYFMLKVKFRLLALFVLFHFFLSQRWRKLKARKSSFPLSRPPKRD